MGDIAGLAGPWRDRAGARQHQDVYPGFGDRLARGPIAENFLQNLLLRLVQRLADFGKVQVSRRYALHGGYLFLELGNQSLKPESGQRRGAGQLDDGHRLVAEPWRLE